MSDAPDWPISVLSDFFSKATHHQTVVFESCCRPIRRSTGFRAGAFCRRASRTISFQIWARDERRRGGPASAPDPPPLEAENSLEDVDGDASLLTAPGPGTPTTRWRLRTPLVDARARGTDDPKARDRGVGGGRTRGERRAGRGRGKTGRGHHGGCSKETPEQVEGPVEEFPADNTPDVIVTLVILPENFQHVLNVKAMTTGAELKDKVVAELPLPYDALSLRHPETDFPDDVALLDVGIKPAPPPSSNSSCARPSPSPSPSPRRRRCPFVDVAVSPSRVRFDRLRGVAPEAPVRGRVPGHARRHEVPPRADPDGAARRKGHRRKVHHRDRDARTRRARAPRRRRASRARRWSART